MPIDINDLSKFDVIYGKQIDFRLLSYNLNVQLNQTLQNALEPHPAIVIETLPKNNLVVAIFGQSITEKKLKELTYKHVPNDYIVVKSETNGLTELTLFQLHSRNINLLKCNDNHFKQKKGSYILGKLDKDEISRLKVLFETHPQVMNIINALKNNGNQVLPLSQHNKKEFKLPRTKIKERKNK